MPSLDGATLNGLLSTPLVLPASVAGALAALFIVLLVLALRRAGSAGRPRVLTTILGLALIAFVGVAVLDRLAGNERAAERRAILARNLELTARATAPGSMLSCLDGGAGETIENSCEKAVFADAQSAASAVAYIGARLTLLADAAGLAQHNDPGLLKAFAAVRRSIELDRFGIAAHVLSARDGCTAEQCPALALLHDTAALKANLRVHAFDTYVARYADAWNKKEPKSEPVAEKQGPAAAPVASAHEPAPPKAPLSSKYEFPSAASIPPVRIMNAEPPLAKEQAGGAGQPTGEKSAPEAKLPVPPKRPQKQAAEPPAR
jgi:hypothetical protein